MIGYTGSWKRLRAFGVGVVLAGLTSGLGCAGRAPRLALDTRMGWAEICRRLESRWGKLRTFEGQIRYVAESPWGNLSGFGRLALDFGADAMVLDLRGPLGIRVLTLYAVGDTLWTYVPTQNTVYYAGTATAGQDVARWRAAASRLILGAPPLSCNQTADVSAYGGEELRVDAASGVSHLRAFLSREWGDLRRARIEWTGARVDLEYEGYRGTKGVRLPGLVRARSEARGIRAALSFEEMRVNGRIRWDRYRIRVPSSARRVPLTQWFVACEATKGGPRLAECGTTP